MRGAVQVTSETSNEDTSIFNPARREKGLNFFFCRVTFFPHSCRYSGNIFRDSLGDHETPTEMIVDCATGLAKEKFILLFYSRQTTLAALADECIVCGRLILQRVAVGSVGRSVWDVRLCKVNGRLSGMNGEVSMRVGRLAAALRNY